MLFQLEEMKMRKLFKDKAFVIGFAIGILIFIAANLYDFAPKGGGFSFDSYETHGVPFAMHESGTMLHINQFIWSGVVANISIVLIFSYILGSIFRFVRSKFAARRSTLK